MGRERSSGFYLFNEVILIYELISILWCVIMWIKVTMISLDLNSRRYSLLTEGTLIPSSTTCNNLGDQINLI